MDTALIIEDEKHCTDRILELLSKCGRRFENVLTAQSVNEAIIKTNKFQPDLIFLDIQLGNETGFDYLSKLENRKFEIIFTTAYDQYAIEAFKFSALDYLLKPIGMVEFKIAIKKYSENLSKDYFDLKMNVLLQNYKNELGSRKITIPTQEGYRFLEICEIMYLRADGNYTHIFLRNGSKITVAKTLKVFDEMLSNSNFFRVHHSSLVNLLFVDKFYKGKGGYLIMEDGTLVNVSVRKKEQFLNALKGCYY